MRTVVREVTNATTTPEPIDALGFSADTDSRYVYDAVIFLQHDGTVTLGQVNVDLGLEIPDDAVDRTFPDDSSNDSNGLWEELNPFGVVGPPEGETEGYITRARFQSIIITGDAAGRVRPTFARTTPGDETVSVLVGSYAEARKSDFQRSYLGE